MPTALSKAVWQARTKGNIIEDAPKQSSASDGATEVASRLVKRRIVRRVSWLLSWDRGRIEDHVTYRASKGRTYRGGEVVERMDQVFEKVLGSATEVPGTQASWSFQSEEAG